LPRPARPSLRFQAALTIIASLIVLVGVIQVLKPSNAGARNSAPKVEIGTSFSPVRAEAYGLDYQAAFRQLEAMHFKVIRISAYWDEVDSEGYDRLDWLMNEAAANHQEVVLTVGMKGLGWPEYFIPKDLLPMNVQEGQDIARDPIVRAGSLLFLQATVARYRANPSIVAWQVENEPFNQAGPYKWSIGRDFLLQEIQAVRDLDLRPVVVNAFSHFNFMLDQASQRKGFDLGSLLGFDSGSVENESLQVLEPGDILGLDVYTRIGYNLLGQNSVGRAGNDWADQAGRWHAIAQKQHKRTWVMEAQAEPWESSTTNLADPRSFGTSDMLEVFNGLKEEGFTTILLWGAEYWLWRAADGDPTWLDTANSLLHQGSHTETL
jgi:hypothetical protein